MCILLETDDEERPPSGLQVATHVESRLLLKPCFQIQFLFSGRDAFCCFRLRFMDFPEAQKWISHPSQRQHCSADTSPSTSISENADGQYGVAHSLSQTVTPQISRMSRPPISTRVTTMESAMTRDPSFEVDWEDDDPNNPRNWPTWYKGIIIFAISFSTLVVYVFDSGPTRNRC